MPVEYPTPRQLDITVDHDAGTVRAVETQEFDAIAYIYGMRLPAKAIAASEQNYSIAVMERLRFRPRP